MTMFLTIAAVVLIFVVIFQIAKASEYVSVLKGEEVTPTGEQAEPKTGKPVSLEDWATIGVTEKNAQRKAEELSKAAIEEVDALVSKKTSEIMKGIKKDYSGFVEIDGDHKVNSQAFLKSRSVGISDTSTILNGLPSGTSLAAISSMVRPHSGAGTMIATPPASVG